MEAMFGWQIVAVKEGRSSHVDPVWVSTGYSAVECVPSMKSARAVGLTDR